MQTEDLDIQGHFRLISHKTFVKIWAPQLKNYMQFSEKNAQPDQFGLAHSTFCE